jgi:very-short-patch-repair endonuclease
LEKKLIIELDGGQHAETNEYDSARTLKLETDGFQVLRL